MLPQELIEAIVDCVPDKSCLEACALSAHTFVAPTQRRLFQRLELPRLDPFDPSSFERSLKRLERAANLFSSSSPHLADLVLDLEIANGNSDCGPMLTLLRSLRKVQRLRFRGTLKFAYSDVFYQGLVSFIRQPSMQTIVLDVRTDGASAIFAAALGYCRNIYVDLRTYEDGHDIVPDYPQDDAEGDLDIQGPIENLIMTRSPEMATRLLRPELTKHLRRVRRVEIYGPDQTLLTSLPSACPALTTVAIHHSGLGGTKWLASAHFPTVTLLELFLPLAIVWTTRLGEAVPHLPSCFPEISELRLHLSLYMPTPHSAANEQQYAQLDERLSDFMSSSKIKVNFILRYTPHIGSISRALFRAYFDDMLPRTRNSGRLAIFHASTASTCPEWDREDHSYGELPLDRLAGTERVAMYGEGLDGAGLLLL